MDFDFGDAAVVETLDKVPEQFRPLYAETPEKKFAIKSADPAIKGAVEAIVGLNRALKAERATKKPTVDLSPLKDYGATPEEIKAKLDEMAAQVTANAKIDVKKIKDEMATQFKGEIDKREARVLALKSILDGHLIDSALKGAIASEKGDVDLLLPFARGFMKPLEVDGKYTAMVVDEAGNARYSGITGLPLSPSELVKEMKANPKFGKLFEPDAKSGGGAKPGAASRTQQAPNSTANLSAMDKIRMGLDAMQTAR
jgi:hypothetical protein